MRNNKTNITYGNALYRLNEIALHIVLVLSVLLLCFLEDVSMELNGVKKRNTPYHKESSKGSIVGLELIEHSDAVLKVVDVLHVHLEHRHLNSKELRER